MRTSTMTESGFVTGVVLSILLGIALTWQASREGAGLQPSADIPHPWLHGIAVNGMCVGVFVVPLATVFGRWIGDYLTWRSRKNSRTTSTTNDSALGRRNASRALDDE